MEEQGYPQGTNDRPAQQMSDAQFQMMMEQRAAASKRPEKGKGLGIAGMILGIIAAINAFIPLINILSLPIAIVGLILSIIGMVQARNSNGPAGFGIAGLICSATAIIITIVMYLVPLMTTNAAINAINDYSAGSSGDNSPLSTQDNSADITLGSTFDFNELEITIGTQLSTTTFSNQFSEHDGKTVIVVPMTVKNLSSENKSLNMFYVKSFGSQGTELDDVTMYFSDTAAANITTMGEARPGATLSGNYYMLYDGNGDYYLNFDEWIGQELEVRIPVNM